MLTTDCHKNFEIFNVYVSHERRKGRIGVELLNGDKSTLASVKFVLAQKIQPSVYFIYDKVFSSTLSLLISQQSNDFEDKCISSWLVLTHIGTEILEIFHIPTGSFVEFPDKNVFSQCKLRVSRFLCMYFSLNFIPFVWSYIIYSSAKNILIEPVQDRCRENMKTFKIPFYYPHGVYKTFFI